MQFKSKISKIPNEHPRALLSNSHGEFESEPWRWARAENFSSIGVRGLKKFMRAVDEWGPVGSLRSFAYRGQWPHVFT